MAKWISVLIWWIAVATSYGDSISIGPSGINSRDLGLTGRGIAIGQVEPFRPGRPGIDAVSLTNEFVQPVEVWHQKFPALTDEFIDEHAVEVAGVMISNDTSDSDSPPDMAYPVGVAPGASLYAGAYEPFPGGDTPYSIAQETAQRIATRNGGDVRAINMSFGFGLTSATPLPDGNAQLTLFVDWSARRHDTLYVVAGAQSFGFPVPTDNFNGLTIARSTKGFGTVYDTVDPGNDYFFDATGPRSSVDLTAPGVEIEVTGFGGAEPEETGTSFAAPHVVGTVALLQQYGDSRILAGSERWGLNARRHEVMKAVLMNSADKIKDNGVFAFQGALLGMERTLEDGFTRNWFESEAYTDTNGDVPLDMEMGAGHLNAKRAWQQFATGEYEPNSEDVPLLGWDYGTTLGASSINKYPMAGQVAAGGFVSATLAWDRRINFLTDSDTPDEYDSGDVFEDWDVTPPEFSFNRMFLYLMPAGSTSTAEAVAKSVTEFENLQHIFFPVPDTGEYELWIEQLDEDQFSDEFSQDYALAWWGAGATVTHLGDLNSDGSVNAADLAQWTGDFALNDDSDADSDGDTDGNDFVIWQRNLGSGAATPSNSAVPEPSAWLLAALGLPLVKRRPWDYPRIAARNFPKR